MEHRDRNEILKSLLYLSVFILYNLSLVALVGVGGGLDKKFLKIEKSEQHENSIKRKVAAVAMKKNIFEEQ